MYIRTLFDRVDKVSCV